MAQSRVSIYSKNPEAFGFKADGSPNDTWRGFWASCLADNAHIELHDETFASQKGERWAQQILSTDLPD